MTDNVTIVGHPLVQHKLTLMRQKRMPSADFRRLQREVGTLLAYEVTRDLPIEYRRIDTPLATMNAPVLSGKKLCLVSILRAGNGILDGVLDLVPEASVGHVGLYRDPATLVAVEYYFKVPEDMSERLAIVIDSMLATGNSAIAAVQRVKDSGAPEIKLVCLLAAPEGLAAFTEAHPDVQVIIAAIDERLDEHGYIVPGIGDAGDRLYGTQ